MSATLTIEPKVGDVLKDFTVVGYPTVVIRDIQTREGERKWLKFSPDPNQGFQFMYYVKAYKYDIWYGDRSLGQACRRTDGTWVGRWGRNADQSPHYNSPVEAAQWLLVHGSHGGASV